MRKMPQKSFFIFFKIKFLFQKKYYIYTIIKKNIMKKLIKKFLGQPFVVETKVLSNGLVIKHYNNGKVEVYE